MCDANVPPPRLRNEPFSAYMADNEACEWVLELYDPLSAVASTFMHATELMQSKAHLTRGGPFRLPEPVHGYPPQHATGAAARLTGEPGVRRELEMHSMKIRGKADLESAAQFAHNAAFVALALASVTFSGRHSEIPHIIRQWVEAEVRTTEITVKDLNTGVLTPEEEAFRDRLEEAFEAKLKDFLVATEAVKNLEIQFRGDPRNDGPAIRVKWDGCPSNGFSDGLILPVA